MREEKTNEFGYNPTHAWKNKKEMREWMKKYRKEKEDEITNVFKPKEHSTRLS